MGQSVESTGLQRGIYLEPGTLPAAFLFLVADFAPDCRREAASDALARVWTVLEELRLGSVRDLETTRPDEESVRIDPDTFDALLGYGASFFEEGRDLTMAERPELLAPLAHPGGPFPKLRWMPSAAPRVGEGDLCVQLTGRDPHVVNRAAVEAWKAIVDEGLPLAIRATYGGFARDDGRSWIGFHDGVSNIRPSQRRVAVECGGDPDWNRGGTYLAFMRCAVDLGLWRGLSREEQEVLVGRDKLSGNALRKVRTEPSLDPRPFPVASPGKSAADSEVFRDPPETGDPIVESSHVHRGNQNRAEPSSSAAHRIFRQGYEYLDGIGPKGPRLGLNFISFQRDLEHLRQILGLGGWLGGVNFGGRADHGPGEPEPIELISLAAAGFYAVPPQASPFPGAELFR